MNLERTAAEAFIEELQKLASVDGEKTASDLLGVMDVEQIEEFLKQAGFGDMMGGIGRGLVGLGKGAVQGAGSVAAGAGRGLMGAARNAGAAVGGASSGVMNSLKAIPGRVGQGMTNLGQRAEQKLTGMGQGLANAGAAKGQAIQGRLSGPAQPAAAPKPVASSQNVESGAYKPPMMSMGQQVAQSNPFHGMGDSLASGARDIFSRMRGGAQPAAGAPQAPAATPIYGGV